MLAKRYRLTKRGSFAYVYKKGETARGKHFTLVFVRGKDVPRIGVSVGNKVGHAVVRNKLKRRIRAVIGSKIRAIKPCQAIVAAKKDAASLTFAEVESEICSLIAKSNLAIDEKKD